MTKWCGGLYTIRVELLVCDFIVRWLIYHSGQTVEKHVRAVIVRRLVYAEGRTNGKSVCEVMAMACVP